MTGWRPISCVMLLGALAQAPVAVANPRTDYILHCRGCHGPDGAGVPDRVPDLRGQLGKFVGVPGGREYVIRVPGTAQAALSDARIAALLNWMLITFSGAQLPPTFTAFSEAEVARVRRPPLTDVATVREQLLSAIAARERQTRQEGMP